MTTILLVDHFPDCTPLTPCLSCRVARFLKTKLGAEDMQELIEIVKDAQKVQVIDLDASIDELDLPQRVLNMLRAEQITTIREILMRTENQFLNIPDLGRKSLELLKEALARRGRKIGDNLN